MEKTESIKLTALSMPPLEVASLSELEEYCDVCFIAFGSQESRTHKAGKVVHFDCARRM